MREEFILNIYKNDEWAPLWAAEDKAQRLGIGEGRDEEIEKFSQGKGYAKISHKGGCYAKISHKGGCYAKFSYNTIHSPFCNFEARSNGENFWILRVGNAG